MLLLKGCLLHFYRRLAALLRSVRPLSFCLLLAEGLKLQKNLMKLFRTKIPRTTQFYCLGYRPFGNSTHEKKGLSAASEAYKHLG